MKLEFNDIDSIKHGLINKKFSCKELINHYISQIKQFDNKINAFITVCENEAKKKAEIIDSKISKNEHLGSLAGIPVSIKDNICTKDIKTTCGSKMLSDFYPPYNATVVNKLLNEDAIIIGKTNMDEFAMGSSTETSYYKKTKNPWNLNKVPGGSSGGAASSVSSNFSSIAIGSDTGGSIRQPSSFCGVVGLKPTYGLVSRYGLIAFASSFDQIGPITKTVKDCAHTLNYICGKDYYDSTSIKINETKDYLSNLSKDIKGLKIGIPKEFFSDNLNPEIKSSIENSISIFESLGVDIDEFSLNISDSALSLYYIISSAEASSNLARYDGIRYGYRTKEYNNIDELIIKTRTEGFGPEVKRRIMLGNFVLSSGYYDEYYRKASLLRKKLCQEYNNIFKKYDIILTPTSPVLPFDFDDKTKNPLDMYLTDIYTVYANITGSPALSMLCGFSKDNLPIGLQLIGNHLDEETLFRTAYALEQYLNIYKITPNELNNKKNEE